MCNMDKNLSNLSLGHLNICHFKNKVHELSVLLKDNDATIFGLSETRLAINERLSFDCKVEDEVLCPANYKL